ncbi:MAG: extracellular solute-binding protein [Candidatus Kapabacteria bacterium]|nr:extracellular solute-binding protein [Candidatus Kapabacteria bacterium]
MLTYYCKLAVTLLLSVLAIGFMGGCQNGEKLDDGKATIRFWHFWSEPGQKAALRELVNEFEKASGCRVELTELSWNDGKAKLQAAFNSGAPPDVVELGSDWVAQFSGAGVLSPLTTIDTSALINYTLAPGRFRGALYAAPWVVDTRVLYVNQNLVSASGVDSIAKIEDLQNAAEFVRSKGQFGWGSNGADAHRLYKKILPFLWTYGGDVLDASGRCVLYSPANVRALTCYAELSRTGIVETQRQLDATFLQGRLGIWNSGSWLIKKIRANNSLSVKAIAFPGIDGRPGVSFAGGEYLAVSASSKQVGLSERLVAYLIAPSSAKSFCSKIPEAGFPAATSAYDDPSLQADPFKSVFAKQLRHARMTPVHPKWLDIEAVLESAVVRVLLGEATADKALREAHDEVIEIIGS